MVDGSADAVFAVPATVIAVDGDYAEVRVEQTGCGRCHEEGGCGGNNLGNLLCRTPRSYRVRNPGHAPIGASVQVAIAPGAVRRSALLAYAVPLAALFAGAFAGEAVGGDGAAIVGAFVALLCAWLAVRRYSVARRAADGDGEPFIRS